MFEQQGKDDKILRSEEITLCQLNKEHTAFFYHFAIHAFTLSLVPYILWSVVPVYSNNLLIYFTSGIFQFNPKHSGSKKEFKNTSVIQLCCQAIAIAVFSDLSTCITDGMIMVTVTSWQLSFPEKNQSAEGIAVVRYCVKRGNCTTA